jgi:hypothetical protein
MPFGRFSKRDIYLFVQEYFILFKFIGARAAPKAGKYKSKGK